MILLLQPLNKYTTSDPFFDQLSEDESSLTDEVIWQDMVDKYKSNLIQVPQNLVLLTPDFYLSLPEYPESLDAMIK